VETTIDKETVSPTIAPQKMKTRMKAGMLYDLRNIDLITNHFEMKKPATNRRNIIAAEIKMADLLKKSANVYKKTVLKTICSTYSIKEMMPGGT
jgi:hypothetical protein